MHIKYPGYTKQNCKLCPCRCSGRAPKSQGGLETYDGSKAVIENVDDCLEKQNVHFCFRCRYGEVGGLLFGFNIC